MSQTFVSVADGDWSDPAIWSPQGVPSGPGALVTINNSVTIAVGETFAVSGVGYGAGGDLTLLGDLDIGGPVSPSTAPRPTSGDFALSWNGAALALDWSINGPDLALEQGLYTAVAISLFTDRLAAADDVIPDGSTDRRGWWGDLPLPGASSDGQPDRIGSRLWLLSRAKATPQTAALARQYCAEALAWMITDGVAASVQVGATWLPNQPPMLEIVIQIARTTAAGQAVNETHNLLWSATMAAAGA